MEEFLREPLGEFLEESPAGAQGGVYAELLEEFLEEAPGGARGEVLDNQVQGHAY